MAKAGREERMQFAPSFVVLCSLIAVVFLRTVCYISQRTVRTPAVDTIKIPQFSCFQLQETAESSLTTYPLFSAYS